MLIHDIFRDDLFSAIEMTESASEVEYKPSAIGAMNLYEDEPIRTIEFGMWRREGELILVPETERGTSEPTPQKRGRGKIMFETGRLIQRERIHASELLGAYSEHMPYEQALATVDEEVAARQDIMRGNHELTEEYHRMGGLTGLLRDANGSIIYDYFDEFGFAQPAYLDVDLSEAANLNLRQHTLENITYPVADALKGAGRLTTGVSIHALAGRDYFSGILGHPRREKTYEGYAAAAELRDGHDVMAPVSFGGVTYHPYWGIGDVDIPADEAWFFPRGARDVFKRVLSPGEGFADLGTRGRDLYSWSQPDAVNTENPRHMDVFLGNYARHICKVPQALMRARRTN